MLNSKYTFATAFGSTAVFLAMGASADSLLTTTFENGSVFKGYGQINQAYLYYNDGDYDRGYAPVDNDNSSSRFGVTYDSEFGAVRFQFRAEAEYQVRPSNELSQLDSDATDWTLDRNDVRFVDFSFKNDSAGELYIGQGSMASDGIAELDLSGTGVIGYSSVSDTAAGFFFRQKDGTLSSVTVGDGVSNLDGSRRARIRYDSPNRSGFRLAGAYGQEVINENDDNDYYDLSLKYRNKHSATEVHAGIGYNWVMADKNGTDREFYSGSVSALHDNGINFTLAGGSEQTGGDGSFGYAKLGWIHGMDTDRATSFAIDYYSGRDFNGDGSQSDSYSVMAVQRIDQYNLELYGIYRVYAYDDKAANYDDGAAFMTGVRWKF